MVKKQKFKFKNQTSLLRWVPIVLMITLAIFMEIFAFDEPILSLGFLIHSIPSLLILVIALVSYYKPLIGGILFVILGIATVFFFDTYENIFSFFIISMPLVLMGLMLAYYWHRMKSKK